MKRSEHALASGVEQFEMMPALDDSPDFIAALASLVRAAVAAEPQGQPHPPHPLEALSPPQYADTATR